MRQQARAGQRSQLVYSQLPVRNMLPMFPVVPCHRLPQRVSAHGLQQVLLCLWLPALHGVLFSESVWSRLLSGYFVSLWKLQERVY